MIQADGEATPGTAAITAADAERRLHPMSWLFVLLQQLKQFVLPLIAAFFFGGDRNELWPLVGVAVLAMISVWRYFTYRYGIAGEALVIRSGLLERHVRVIPFARIHNIAVEQSMLHRLFGVAEVRLESAGGQKPEAQMRVLKLDDALALETLVRRGARGRETVEPTGTRLLALSAGELVRLGLVSNRGLIVAGAALGALTQLRPRLLPALLERWSDGLLGWAIDHGQSNVNYVLAALGLFTAAVLVLRAFSVLLALLQYHGFTLSEHGRRLTIERGLLARWRTSASRRRIQAWTLREGVLHRMLGRRSLEVDTAVVEQHDQERALRELAPIATPDACEALIEHLLPGAAWSHLQWRALPTHAWWRLFAAKTPWVLIPAVVLAWNLGPWASLPLLLLPWFAYTARRHAGAAAYALSDELIAVREGWWSRHWRFAELDKLQALQLVRNPVDRRCGTASLWLDTAGAGALTPPLRIRFLPEAQARSLYAQLSHALARKPLRW